MTVVLTTIEDQIATITINRPEAMNALSRPVREALAAAFRTVAGDEGVRVVILTGAGDRAFTAGLDLEELGADTSNLGAANGTGKADDIVAAMAACPKPIIGAVNGVAITGGFEIALCCDVLIASSGARFADTHARVGIMPGWGLSQRLSRLIGPYRARELSLSGNFLDAATAERWGLVNRVVAPDELMAAAMALAKDMVSIDPEMSQAYKRLINDGYALSFGDGLELEDETSRSANAKVKSEDVEERRRKVMERGRGQPA